MSHNTIQGNLSATGQRFGIVVSRFNDFLTMRLLDGALDCLERHGVERSSISVAYVPGALEIPPVAARMASSDKYDAVLCLGAVIRGDTPHFDFVAAESAKGIARVGFDSQVPVVYGVITTDNLEQAIERAGSKSGNKGWDAAQTGIEMVNLYREMV